MYKCEVEVENSNPIVYNRKRVEAGYRTAGLWSLMWVGLTDVRERYINGLTACVKRSHIQGCFPFTVLSH